MTKHIRPAVYLADTVDPAEDGEITGLIAVKDDDGTLCLSILGNPYPSIILDGEDIAALTNLLHTQEMPKATPRPADADIPANAVAYYGGRFMLDLQPEPPKLGPRDACTQALEHLDNITDLLDTIWPGFAIAAIAEKYLNYLHTMIQTRLTAIEDALFAQSPITNRPVTKSPSPHNASLPEQEDAPS
jgi:hypothetical protein